MLGSNSQRIPASIIHTANTPRKLPHEQPPHFDVSVLRGEHKRRIVINISANLVSFMASLYKQLGDFEESARGGEVQTRVTFVFEVRVLQKLGVVADNAGDEDGVVEEDCAAEAGGGVDPAVWD